MSTNTRKQLHILKMIFQEKFPDKTVGFYLSKRKKYFHMVLEQLLSSIKGYKEFKEEIYKFLFVNLDENFKVLEPPLLVPTVRWKHDYILIKNEPRK